MSHIAVRSPRRTSLTLLVALALIGAALAGVAQAAEPKFPFGKFRQTYAAGALRPTVSLGAQKLQIQAFYDKWKAAYLKPGCGAGQYYVKADTDTAMVVSESQGYGMLIVAMMAGYDPDAQTLFDGLHRYNLAHPSSIDPMLLAASQDTRCRSIDGTDSATDGDMDIAYALLLAHRQWGSTGTYDYRRAANRVSLAINRRNVNPDTKLVNLGDWVSTENMKYYYATRSSDWMPDHFRAFARAIQPAVWTPVLDAHLALIDRMQTTYAPATGLLPDFIVNANTTPRPAPADFLEGPQDGRYSYNACRDPWRIGLDAALWGDARSKAAARRMSVWIRAKTGGRASAIRDGYALNGAALVEYGTMSFIAPFAVAAISDPDGQAWLDLLWRTIVAAEPQGYYPDSLKLLSMLAVSRNWLAP